MPELHAPEIQHEQLRSFRNLIPQVKINPDSNLRSIFQAGLAGAAVSGGMGALQGQRGGDFVADGAAGFVFGAALDALTFKAHAPATQGYFMLFGTLDTWAMEGAANLGWGSIVNGVFGAVGAVGHAVAAGGMPGMPSLPNLDVTGVANLFQ